MYKASIVPALVCALSIGAMCELRAAETKDSEVNLNAVEVTASPEDDPTTKKVGETKKSAETLSKQQVSDSRDLVKYETGVTVVESGRFGASGYAIRGVDENRVAITIDGLRQAETLSSQGFKELFEGYGNFNNTRNGVEMENVKVATITKGADSIKTGSGALGGSVMFETKDARDYLVNKDYYFGFKHGYQSANSQNMRSLTLAGKFKLLDLLIVNTTRDGHETKNYFYDMGDKTKVGREREVADPYNITRKSTMVKVGFQPSDEHRFSIMHDDSTLNTDGEDLSYSLRYFKTNTTQEAHALGERKNHDKSTRKNIQFAYENLVETPLWDSFKISYSTQKIKNKAKTDEYCSNDNCNNVRNPSGLNLTYDKDAGVYKVVDKSGREPTVELDTSGWTTEKVIKDSNNNLVEWYNNGGKTDSTFINCDVIDCTKKIRVSALIYDGTNYRHEFVDRDIIVGTTPNGIKYGKVDIKSHPYNPSWDPGNTYYNDEESQIIMPQSYGYAENQYHDRDLDTDTKQFNIDFEKEFKIAKTEHALKYGAMIEKTKKSMTDMDGYNGMNVKWWANSFINSEFKPSDPNAVNGYVLHPDRYPRSRNVKSNTGTKQTYLIPVTTESSAFYIGDDVKLTDWIGFDLNYRYDVVKHKPSYDKNIPVPKGMITGIFVPLPFSCNPYNSSGGYNQPCAIENFEQNLALLLREKEFKSDSYSLGVNLDPLDFMRFQVKYSKGFRAPTSDEMYMTFKHPSFSIAPNTDLKAEIAKTKEAALTFYKSQSFITFNVFKTDYKNFIDLVYQGEREVDYGSGIRYPFWRNINRDNAKVTGFEVSSKVSLGDVLPSLEGFRVGYKFTHQKGRMNDNIPMNVIQPTTSIYTLGYSTPGDKYGVDFFITNVAAKKAEDTYNMYWEQQRDDPSKLVQGKRVTDSMLAWRSGAYTVIDMIAYAKPQKNFSFSFGLYNITDKKYMTWDMARSIRAFGTSNLINQDTGAGIGRFYAPRRNFKFNWEIKF
jgi:probable hemoglobin and hemoglobin-haptoglobin-binding protein 3